MSEFVAVRLLWTMKGIHAFKHYLLLGVRRSVSALIFTESSKNPLAGVGKAAELLCNLNPRHLGAMKRRIKVRGKSDAIVYMLCKYLYLKLSPIHMIVIHTQP